MCRYGSHYDEQRGHRRCVHFNNSTDYAVRGHHYAHGVDTMLTTLAVCGVFATMVIITVVAVVIDMYQTIREIQRYDDRSA